MIFARPDGVDFAHRLILSPRKEGKLFRPWVFRRDGKPTRE
jgi:hypothetical protein